MTRRVGNPPGLHIHQYSHTCFHGVCSRFTVTCPNFFFNLRKLEDVSRLKSTEEFDRILLTHSFLKKLGGFSKIDHCVCVLILKWLQIDQFLFHNIPYFWAITSIPTGFEMWFPPLLWMLYQLEVGTWRYIHVLRVRILTLMLKLSSQFHRKPVSSILIFEQDFQDTRKKPGKKLLIGINTNSAMICHGIKTIQVWTPACCKDLFQFACIHIQYFHVMVIVRNYAIDPLSLWIKYFWEFSKISSHRVNRFITLPPHKC